MNASNWFYYKNRNRSLESTVFCRNLMRSRFLSKKLVIMYAEHKQPYDFYAIYTAMKDDV